MRGEVFKKHAGVRSHFLHFAYQPLRDGGKVLQAVFNAAQGIVVFVTLLFVERAPFVIKRRNERLSLF